MLVMTEPLFEQHMRQDVVQQCKQDFTLQREHWWEEVVRQCEVQEGRSEQRGE